MKAKKLFLLCVLVAVVLPVAGVQADMITDVDATIRDAVSSNNDHLTSYDLFGSGSFWGLSWVTWLKFDIPILAGQSLVKAELYLGPLTSGNGVYEPGISAGLDSNDAWTTRNYADTADGPAIWITSWNGSGTYQDTLLIRDITSLLTQTGEGLGETLSLRLWHSSGGGTRSFHAGGDCLSYIKLTTIPEPGTLVLLGCGALLGIARRRRRRS